MKGFQSLRSAAHKHEGTPLGSVCGRKHANTHTHTRHSALVLPGFALVVSHSRRHKCEFVPRSRASRDVCRATTCWGCPAAVVMAINQTDKRESCRCRTKIQSIICFSASGRQRKWFILLRQRTPVAGMDAHTHRHTHTSTYTQERWGSAVIHLSLIPTCQPAPPTVSAPRKVTAFQWLTKAL